MDVRQPKSHEAVMRVNISSDAMLIDTPVRPAPYTSHRVTTGALTRPESPDDEILEDAPPLLEESSQSFESDDEATPKAAEVDGVDSSSDDDDNDDDGFHCVICCENRDGKPIQPCWACEEEFCRTCLRRMFLDASKDETSMPPRCCGPLPLAYGRLVLSEEEVERYKLKYEECRSWERLYCPIPTCSAFLPARVFQRQGGEDALLHCLECKVELCGKCKNIAHPEGMCGNVRASTDLDPELEDLLKQWGIKRCPRCKAGIRRMWGCNHMQCRCGAHFCWFCLKHNGNCLDGVCPEAEASENYDARINDAARLREDAAMRCQLDAAATNADETGTAPACSPQAHPAGSTQGADGADVAGDEETAYVPYAPPILNLDAGWFWEDATEDFGDEPTFDETPKYYECEHGWTCTVKRKLSSKLIFECDVCWQRIYPCVCGYTSQGGGGASGQPSEGTITDHSGSALCSGHPAVQKSSTGDAAFSGIHRRTWMTRCKFCNFIVCPECHEAEVERAAARET